jgi:uncharacterized protein
MATVKAFITRHPVLSYYVLTFAISWGSFLTVVGLGPGGFAATPEQVQAMVPLLVPAMLLGPGLVSLLLTGVVDGRAGLRAFRARLLTWQVGPRWYAAAVLTAPLVFAAVYLPLSRVSPVFLPRIVTTGGKASLLLTAVAMGLLGAFLEELGWTGFAIPELRRRHGVLTTGLIAGVLWGAWHIPLTYWTTGDPASVWPSSLALFLPVYLVGGVGGLTAYRVLMVWVYARTGSLLVATLMHASLIVGNIYLLAPAVTGAAYWAWSLASTAALWGVVAVAMVTSGQRATAAPDTGGLTPGTQLSRPTSRLPSS